MVAGGGCEGGCAVTTRAETIVLLLITRKNELKRLSGSVVSVSKHLVETG